MVAKSCYCFLCACRSKLFVCKWQVPAEGTTHRISSACGGFIVVPTSNFVGLFWTNAWSWSSVIRHTASHAATLLHHNEFFLISILLIDLFAFFSFYKILKISNYGAVHFFMFYPCVKKILVLMIRFQEKLIQNLELLFHSQFLRNNPAPISRTISAGAIVSVCV